MCKIKKMTQFLPQLQICNAQATRNKTRLDVGWSLFSIKFGQPLGKNGTLSIVLKWKKIFTL